MELNISFQNLQLCNNRDDKIYKLCTDKVDKNDIILIL